MSKFLLRRYLFVPRVFSPFPISALENHFEQSCLAARYTFSELLFNCFSYTLSTNTRISIANSLLMTYNIANIRFHRSKRKKDLRNGIYVLLSWNKWRPIYSTNSFSQLNETCSRLWSSRVHDQSWQFYAWNSVSVRHRSDRMPRFRFADTSTILPPWFRKAKLDCRGWRGNRDFDVFDLFV